MQYAHTPYRGQAGVRRCGVLFAFFFLLRPTRHHLPPLRTLVNGEGAASNGSGPLELQELLEVRAGGGRGLARGCEGLRGAAWERMERMGRRGKWIEMLAWGQGARRSNSMAFFTS